MFTFADKHLYRCWYLRLHCIMFIYYVMMWGHRVCLYTCFINSLSRNAIQPNQLKKALCLESHEGVWEIGSISPLILNLIARWKQFVNFTPYSFAPGDRAPVTHWIYGWLCPRAPTGNRIRKRKHYLLEYFMGYKRQNVTFGDKKIIW